VGEFFGSTVPAGPNTLIDRILSTATALVAAPKNLTVLSAAASSIFVGQYQRSGRPVGLGNDPYTCVVR
jgi:hypothetical protein